MTSTSSLIQVEGIHKSFGGPPALADLSLGLGSDELLVVLGPTGAGKTTLLRILAGLEWPDQGRILIQGTEALNQVPAQRDLALVFQNFSLYPEWTVRENLEFPLRAPGRNLDEARISARVEEAASLLHIGKLLDRPSQRLSGGEMQRVALGRALVRRPKAFLLDEPLSNLDAKLREELRVELVELRRRLKIPMIFVTHDQEEAFAMADRVAVLDRGRLLQTGTPDEIYSKPASPAVALQLGRPRINLLREGTGTIGIRPEDVALSGGPDSSPILAVEDQGPSKVVIFQWKGQPFRALTSPDFSLKPGNLVHPRMIPTKSIFWES